MSEDIGIGQGEPGGSGTSRVHGPEGLKVYQLALELGNLVDALLRRWPCREALRDQLLRAVDSVIFNIAEGAAHFSPGMKARSYELAAGSAAEVRAALHRLHRAHPSADIAPARQATMVIGAMLVRLIHTQNTRKKLTRSPSPPPIPIPIPPLPTPTPNPP